MLTKEKINEYKEKLEEQKQALIGQLEAEDKPENFGSDVDSLDEEANEAQEFANQQAIGQTLRDRISEIDSALNKILSNKYGSCENCGKEISAEVLDVIPESKLCEDCKKKEA